MALLTLGTASTTSLQCLVWQPAGMSYADASALAAYMVPDDNRGPAGTSNGQMRGWFGANGTNGGRLFLPRERGVINLIPGDVVAVDTQTGFPFVLSTLAANSNPAWVIS